ncbi:MAG TPA: SIMPL domain-containing protein [Methanolinea sp.]|jgi:uncharacterized protein YggE|nr:MAG: oxidative stress defense protein [Methanoregulaceae archaeon PtaB.Bin009]OPY38852.1 MAG: oxidative stress defense protein [Methanoregulaceae archaeon PtaU1.Bin066]HII76508.1 SIMPL domain-containing protein [Methanolinea sp.]HNQ28601.1 SIMPL domain-containing protein [Methanolinea sp.]
MSRSRYPLIAVLLLLGIALLASGVSAAENGDRMIITSATAETMVTPDRAQVTVSVQTENADVKVAQAENARMMDEVRRALESAGIALIDMKTTGYSIYPVYDDSGSLFRQKVKYYRVTNSLQVTVRDVSRTGEVIDIAVGAGANQVDSIIFMVSEDLEQTIRADLLTKAVKKARGDADVVAAASGVNITGVKEISVGGYYPPVLYENVRGGAADMKTQAAIPTPIEPGQVKITAQVTASYLIG